MNRTEFLILAHLFMATNVLNNHTFAQYPSYDGCADLSDGNFRMEILISKALNHPLLHEPIRMAFDPDSLGNVHFYFIERRGKIKYYDAVEKTISEVGHLDIFINNGDPTEHGLIGLALDPDFETNRWMYLFHSLNENGIIYQVARYTIDGQNQLDEASKVVILNMPTTGAAHTGGDMLFDKYGDLWMTVGETYLIGCYEPGDCYHHKTDPGRSDEMGPPNTHNYRGSILRIHPEPDGSYTIPDGNFGEYFGDLFEQQGEPELAGQYRDPGLVLPEVYAKGFRNPYTITYDPVTEWITASDCGSECRNYDGLDPEKPWCPDSAKGEEHNILTHPGFFGWPYFHGDNHPYADPGAEKDPLAPINDSPFSDGVDVLPPAIPGTHSYRQECAITGPIYRYDDRLESDVKFPPHFDGVWLVTDYNQGWIKAVTLNDEGENTGVSQHFFPFELSYPVSLRQGPDGALYAINYSCSVRFNSDQCTNIARIEYIGDCRPVGTGRKPDARKEIAVTGNEIIISSDGEHHVAVYDIKGNAVYSVQGAGIQVHDLSNVRATGIYTVTVKTEMEHYSRSVLIDFQRDMF
jgi:cytochrome c